MACLARRRLPRCHGKDYGGLAAPSIVEYARTQSREMFDRMFLDGEPSRGMPAYRDNPSIAERIGDICRYFLGRADGTTPPTRGLRSVSQKWGGLRLPHPAESGPSSAR